MCRHYVYCLCLIDFSPHQNTRLSVIEEGTKAQRSQELRSHRSLGNLRPELRQLVLRTHSLNVPHPKTKGISSLDGEDLMS